MEGKSTKKLRENNKNIKKRKGMRKRKIKKKSPGTPSSPDESFVSSQNSS